MDHPLNAGPARPAVALVRPSLLDKATDVLVALLDIAFLITLGVALLYAVAGPLRLSFLSVSGLTKPLLQAFVLGSLRLGIPRASWHWTACRRVIETAGAWWDRAVEPTVWWTSAFDALVALLTTRIASKAVGFVAALAYPEFLPRSFTMPFESLKFAETFAAWDSAWYIDIASRGYHFQADAQSNIAFFPLYPLVMRLLSSMLGGGERTLWISGIVISYACFWGALLLIHRLTMVISERREAARRAVLYLAVFPFSFPFTRVYAESLFLLVSVGAVFAAVRGRWSIAGVCGMLAALTRPNGVLIVVPLALLALRDLQTLDWRALWRRTSAVAGAPSGLAAYCGFVFVLSGDPLAWLRAQVHWGYSLGNPPWATLQRTLEAVEAHGLYDYLLATPDAIYALSHALVGLAVVGLTPSIFRRLGAPLGSYVAVGILVPFSGSALEGIGRYSATLFPLFMYLGMVGRSRRAHEALLVVGALWLALNVGLFVTQRPVY